MAWIAERRRRSRFESVVLPHLDAAYALARWLTRNDADAADVVQEAMLRAYRYFDTYAGGDARSWLLRIVRRTCYSWLERNRPAELVPLDAEEEPDSDMAVSQAASNTEALLQNRSDLRRLDVLVEALGVDTMRDMLPVEPEPGRSNAIRNCTCATTSARSCARMVSVRK